MRVCVHVHHHLHGFSLSLSPLPPTHRGRCEWTERGRQVPFHLFCLTLPIANSSHGSSELFHSNPVSQLLWGSSSAQGLSHRENPMPRAVSKVFSSKEAMWKRWEYTPSGELPYSTGLGISTLIQVHRHFPVYAYPILTFHRFHRH